MQDGAEQKDVRARVGELEEELRALDAKVGAIDKATARPLGRAMKGE